ncbi:hypothetical protein ACTG16_21695 [Aeromonas sp. 23P]|uniref:hypothetical protein n=1 Tax=Aeromonas sp. 23P TaxID=3452716 RepID=UPI003F79E1C4
MKVIPKGIKCHPGVLNACLDDDINEDCKGGYRADVILKEGWHFAGLDGNAPAYDEYNRRRTGFFNTLKEFIEAKPTKYTAEELAVKAP